MDSFVCEALNQICARGAAGIPIADLWTRLQPLFSSSALPLCPAVKQPLWAALLRVPPLRALAAGRHLDSADPSIQAAHDAERLGVILVAAEHLLDSSLGLYDIKYSGAQISALQRRTLERLAEARTDGLTQSQLSKELQVKGNNFFYVVKTLESEGLLVRQSSLVRKKDLEVEEGSGIKCTATNLMHLSRYAKHINMNSHQRLDIMQIQTPVSMGGKDEKDCVENDTSGNFIQYDVQIQDYRLAMRAICDRLEESNDKVLVSADVKAVLGYKGGSKSHRAWRRVLKILKDDGFVEEFLGKVGEKVLPCLRLKKKFGSVCTIEGPERIHPITCGSRGQISDLLVELPLDNQVHDLINAEGQKGLLLTEVYERLGIQSRRNHTRLAHIFSKFGMHQQSETHNKTMIYRIWTLDNHLGGGKVKDAKSGGKDLTGEYSCCDRDKQLVIVEDVDSDNHGRVQQDLELALVSKVAEFDAESSETPLSAVTVAQKAPVFTRHHSEQLTQRDQRILQRLQAEKFLLNVELLRWLTSLEKDKKTKICRRTLTNHLSKLQKEGLCKCIEIMAPRVGHCGHNRLIRLVLHPSVESLSPHLLGRIHEKMRMFEKQSRDHTSYKSNHVECLSEVTGIERISVRSSSEVQLYNEALKSSGFILSKMIRARMLHNFLWSYVTGLPNGDGFINFRESYKLFVLDEAIKMMPLQLFLHVVGSAVKDDSLFDKCHLGLRLADLEKHVYQRLVETPAIRRLSLVIDILRRLKLIRLVPKELGVADMILTYALDFNPYVEEPLSSGTGQISDTRASQAKVRHDFVLSKQHAVDAYWKTLEYCYAATDPIAASRAFPGSAVKEVYHFRTWTSNQVISPEQHAKLVKHVPSEVPSRRLSLAHCDRIASELNLSLEQVLHFCGNKKRLNYFVSKEIFLSQEKFNPVTKQKFGKRKASSKRKPQKKLKTDCIIREKENTISNVRHREENSSGATGEVSRDDGSHSLIDHAISYMRKVPRKERFFWNENLERKLVMQYARFRVNLGARFHRVDWESVHDLPAPTECCRRRMAALKQIPSVREAVMKLLNLLNDRYAKHLKFTTARPSASSPREHDPLELKSFCWDDFEEASIRNALDEVFYCKQMAKDAQDKHNLRPAVENVNYKSCSEQSDDVLDSAKKPGHNFGTKQLTSLSVATAVELLKVVLLNSSMVSVVPDLLRLTLMEYSENDLLAAFDYLREKNFLVEGQNSQPFSLSKKFLRNAYSSPFPTNAGRKASQLACWLSDRSKELQEDRVILDNDLQCGKIFHLFALVSSGELLVSPRLPSSGIGEAEEIRGLKRKHDKTQSSSDEIVKEPKSHYPSESDFSRKEKGFPGIAIAASQAFIPRIEALQQFAIDRIESGDPFVTMDSTSFTGDGESVASAVSNSFVGASSANPQWKNISNYAALRSLNSNESKEGMPLSPDLFETIYTAIREAGQQGLQMEKIGNKSESIVEALEVFGLVIKVNAFDSVHVVDATWRTKYCLRYVASHLPSDVVLGRNDAEYPAKKIRRSPSETVMELCDEHKITLVACAGKDQCCLEATSNDNNNSRKKCSENDMTSPDVDVSSTLVNSMPFQRILPWLNGDGSLNNIVYKGLTRRVLGLVMQNPGMLEEHLICEMHVLNPQNCRKLLELMLLDNHISMKEMQQTNSVGPPNLLAGLVGYNAESCREVKLRKHLFANPTSTFLL